MPITTDDGRGTDVSLAQDLFEKGDDRTTESTSARRPALLSQDCAFTAVEHQLGGNRMMDHHSDFVKIAIWFWRLRSLRRSCAVCSSDDVSLENYRSNTSHEAW